VTNSNTSPWLEQIRRTWPIVDLKENAHTDIAIVGGGISGVATAYFLLRDTNKSVILLERNKIAHGATGHNGGQIVAAIEKPISELTKFYSYELISEGLKAIDNSWDLFYSIIEEMGIEIELQIVSTYLALSVDGAHFMLEESRLRKQLGLPWNDILLAEDAAKDIPDDFTPLLRKVPRKELEELTLTHDKRYIWLWLESPG
jgi:hypothetical protein